MPEPAPNAATPPLSALWRSLVEAAARGVDHDGVGEEIAVAILLTIISPLKEPTSEILARARPTLFGLPGARAALCAAGRRFGVKEVEASLAAALPGFDVGVVRRRRTRCAAVTGPALLMSAV